MMIQAVWILLYLIIDVLVVLGVFIDQIYMKSHVFGISIEKFDISHKEKTMIRQQYYMVYFLAFINLGCLGIVSKHYIHNRGIWFFMMGMMTLVSFYAVYYFGFRRACEMAYTHDENVKRTYHQSIIDFFDKTQNKKWINYVHREYMIAYVLMLLTVFTTVIYWPFMELTSIGGGKSLYKTEAMSLFEVFKILLFQLIFILVVWGVTLLAQTIMRNIATKPEEQELFLIKMKQLIGVMVLVLVLGEGIMMCIQLDTIGIIDLRASHDIWLIAIEVLVFISVIGYYEANLAAVRKKTFAYFSIVENRVRHDQEEFCFTRHIVCHKSSKKPFVYQLYSQSWSLNLGHIHGVYFFIIINIFINLVFTALFMLI